MKAPKRFGQFLAFALLSCVCSCAWAQQTPCSLPVNVVVPDLSSLSPQLAEEAVSVWTEETSRRTSDGFFLAGAVGLLPLWTVQRGLPADAFTARDKSHLIPIRSVTVDRGPRRILFVADNGKDTTAAARRMEAAVILHVLTEARSADSFGLLTARGPHIALRLGSQHSLIEEAAEKLSAPAAGRARSEAVLDSLLEATRWLEPPKPGDSIILLAMRLEGRHKVAASSVRKALETGHVRLFGFQFGPITVADLQEGGPFAYSISNGMGSLSTRTGGLATGENTVVYTGPYRYKLTDETLTQLRHAAEGVYDLIVEYYLVQPSFVDPHLTISLSPAFEKRLPPAVLIYPRDLQPCPKPAVPGQNASTRPS